MSRKSEDLVARIRSVFEPDLGDGTSVAEATLKDRWEHDQKVYAEARATERQLIDHSDWMSIVGDYILADALNVFPFFNERGQTFFVPAILVTIVSVNDDGSTRFPLLSPHLASRLARWLSMESAGFLNPYSTAQLQAIRECFFYIHEVFEHDQDDKELYMNLVREIERWMRGEF